MTELRRRMFPTILTWTRNLDRPQLVFLGLLLGVSGLLFAFLKLAGEVREGDTNAFDTAILMAFRNPSGALVAPGWVTEAARDVTALGSYIFLGLLVILIVGYFLIARNWFEAVFFSASVIAATVLSNLLKIGFNRPRPGLVEAPEVFTASFPSGHATMSAVVYLTIGAILAAQAQSRRLKVYFLSAAVVVAVLVGVSRVYLGVHFPTDVIAGWSIGSAWAIGCTLAARWLRARAVTPASARPGGEG